MKEDGSERRKITPERILDALAVSPDGRWFVASAPDPNEDQLVAAKAFAVDGTSAVTLCLGYGFLKWDSSGKFAYVYFSVLSEGSYALPVLQDSGLPRLPSTGVPRIEDLAQSKSAVVIPR